MRQGLIRQVAATYIMKYTCAVMADTLREVEQEKAEADDWLFTKINDLHIKKDEMIEAISAEAEERERAGTACCYPTDLFSTRFFRG